MGLNFVTTKGGSAFLSPVKLCSAHLVLSSLTAAEPENDTWLCNPDPDVTVCVGFLWVSRAQTIMKARMKGAQTGRNLLKKKSDALSMRFRQILRKIIEVS